MTEQTVHFTQLPDLGLTSITESDFIRIIPNSGAPWEEVFSCVLIPEEVSGLRILDVGAGASDAVSKLLDLGADAYAIDPWYKSFSTLRGRVKKNEEHAKKHGVGDLVRRREALDAFSKSAKRNPERYITGSVFSIPFQNNYFDIVYSRAVILGYLNLDIDMLSKAVYECVRVTKPEGTIRLYPWMDKGIQRDPTSDTMRLRNDQRLINKLRRDEKIGAVKIETVISAGQEKEILIIQKAV